MFAVFLIGFAAGIAATPHCLGMCGGFPLYLAGGKGRSAWRQVLFVVGKCFTYSFLGAIAAWLGIIVFRNTSLLPVASYVRVAAGIMIAILGLSMLGIRLPIRKRLQPIADTGLVREIFGGILAGRGSASAFVLGLGVGFLPCPLPMSMLAVAAANHHVLHGIALMAGVGLGTAPGLLAVGLFGSGLNRRFARIGMQLAGIIVLGIGLLMLGRATSAVLKPHLPGKAAPSCCGQYMK